MLDTDTTQFLPRPDEYIVDNEAPGFHILESTRSLKKQWQEKTEFTTLPLGQAPLRWTRYYGKQAYGEPVRSYYCKTAGEGSSRIEWETHLPEAGEYELLVYNDERDDQHVSYNKKEVVAKEPTQTYLFSHEEGSEEIVLETQNIGRGWVSLGRFLFPPGPAKITLLDRGADAGQIIFADAVKWVRKEKSTRIAPQE